MTTLITGGSKCGKSRFGERILDLYSGQKIYIATMQPFGEEAHMAIERHRRQRQGRGFTTMEVYTDLVSAELPDNCGVLLECLGHLCANEMFSTGKTSGAADRIMDGIKHVAEHAEELVIITNQVSSDGIDYPEGTAEYIAVLSEINRRTAVLADRVIECVYGIPVMMKGEMPC